MDISRIPQFYKLSVDQRVRVMRERGLLTKEDFLSLSSGDHTLKIDHADKMIENVIGVLGIPVGLGLNFRINNTDYVVPMAVEEPSIIAAVSSAAKIVHNAGGFTAESTDPILIGQVQVIDVAHPAKAQAALLQHKDEIINLANSLHPKMVARGGGAKDIEVHIHPSPTSGKDIVVLHLLVDTCDAMGANLVNTMCEGIASLVENLTHGKVFLRILSNLSDRALAKATCVIPPVYLEGKGYSGEEVRDGIIIANDFAVVDPYRAVTHNKGVMNGIDAVALATGNDWRAIEAAAHAYAARGSHYTSLTKWYKDDEGNLVGELEMPMKVGIVGGPLQSNPTVAVNHRLLGAKSARELAEIMVTAGLAQNMAALRALATEGIQQGHMTLHARSVAVAAGVAAESFDAVVDRLVECGEIKVWKAQEIIAELNRTGSTFSVQGKQEDSTETVRGELASAHGKIILLGEHAVVYGRHAIAAPVPLAIQAKVQDAKQDVELIIPRWGVDQKLNPRTEQRLSFQKTLGIILDTLGLTGRSMQIEVFPNVPRAMGLGGSAAVAVAIIRALDLHYRLGLTDEGVNSLAFECEKVAHGTPSGIDNTIATFGRCLLYKPGEPPLRQDLEIEQPINFVVGISGVESLTAKMVARVRGAWEKNSDLYERIFNEIDALTLQAVQAIKEQNLEQLGQLMNICQGQLNALQVSNWEIEELIEIARENGALGAKLTGGGGGGSMIALCPDKADQVMKAMRNAGYQAMEVQVG
ncbi:MAG: hydroxymethylglutaryl-CoA reductase, degradative [Gammaproteobacteria bacterium]